MTATTKQELQFFYNVVLPILFCLLLITCTSCTSNRSAEISMYKNYYTATETLLDSIESAHNWVDRYDSDALFDYCKIKHDVNTHHSLSSYHQYYQITQILLFDLDCHFEWTEDVGEEDIYAEWHETYKCINSKKD